MDYTVAPIVRPFSYICCFNRNIEKLDTELKELQPIKQCVQQWVHDDHIQLRVIAPHIEAWLKRVDDVETEVGEIIKEKPEVKKGCLNGWCPNLKLRYSLSKKAVENTKVIVNLRKEVVSCESWFKRRNQTGTESTLPTYTTTIPIKDNTAFKSRILNMEEIIKALTDDRINLIGICGLPGVGKTTMAKEIGKRAIKDGLFIEVAWAVVSQNPSITHVQACIANMLGLKQLGDNQRPDVRALLCARLLQDNKKILVILDDVWEEFDLEGVGIPLGGPNKNFKMLYTSRNRGLWNDLVTKIEIPLEILSKDEAWKLFRDQAGDCVDAPDLQPIAKEIANACGCLPLALVLTGKELSRSSGNFTKNIWEDMRNRLTCSSNTLADMSWSSSLELSYQALEVEEAKHLFLLCCLFEEDKSILVEDLVRYAWGFSLFDHGLRGMGEARNRVFYLAAYLESRYLLLDDPCGSDRKHVKVHVLVRNMGISIASKYEGALGSRGTLSEHPKKDAYEYALVSHGAVTKWPNNDKFQHYKFISVISKEIMELPEELICPNLEFLLLRCHKPKKLSCHFFKVTGKLKVLELYEYAGIIPTLAPLTNLTMLSLEGLSRGVSGYVPVIEPAIGNLLNLEILSFRNLDIEELPEEIGKLVELRLLDLTGTHKLRRIPPGVISSLVRLEELYSLYSKFTFWEGEGEEKGRNANLIEFDFLTHLNTLEICISTDVLIPKVLIFGKWKKYKVVIGDDVVGRDNHYERQLVVRASGRGINANHGGLGLLLRSSDHIFLAGVGCNDLVQELLLQDKVDELQRLKYLEIEDCNTPECLVNTMNRVQQQPNAAATAVYPTLEKLRLCNIVNLREICHGPVPARSFGWLTEIDVRFCMSLRYLSTVECLTQLRSLQIWACDMMEEVFIWKGQQEDERIATNNRIKFPNLETMSLHDLSRLVGFCKGIDQIDFPRLRDLHLSNLGKLERVVHDNSNLSSNSEQNNNVGSFTLFPQKVTFPREETLPLQRFKNVSNELPAFSLSNLKELKVSVCESLRNLLYPSTAAVLVNLQTLIIEDCTKMETIVDREEGQEREIPKTLFPQLIELELKRLPCLTRFCHFTHPIELPRLSKIDISDCRSMNSFSFGDVSAPNLDWQGVSDNCIMP